MPASLPGPKHHLPSVDREARDTKWEIQQRQDRASRFNSRRYDQGNTTDSVVIELDERGNSMAPDRNTQLLLVCVFLVVCILALSVAGLFI